MLKRRIVRGALGTLVAVAFTALVFWLWVVPGAITSRLRSLAPGTRVTFDFWWPGGLSGVRWFEGPQPDAPLWARCERVETDLTWAALLRGISWPGSIVLLGPDVTVRLDAAGDVLTPLKFQRPEDCEMLPAVEVRGGQLRFEQEGRPPMVVREIDGGLKPGSRGLELTMKTHDPAWGRWRVDGTVAPDVRSGTITLSGLNVATTVEQTRCLPFVPSSVWNTLSPSGPLDVRETIQFNLAAPRRVQTQAWVNLRGADLQVPALNASIEAARGQIQCESGLVRFDHVNGAIADGTVSVNGTLDLRGDGPVIQVELRLEDVAVSRLPASFDLMSVDLRDGRLNGVAQLVARVYRDRADLSGSTGEATVRQAKLGDASVNRLNLHLTADGNSLHYETDNATPDSSP
jgi:hypothetical protein